MPNGASTHPRIQPDTASPSIEGYFRLPAVWIGDSPEPQSVLKLNVDVHHHVVFEQTLSCGIKTYVQRDGTVLFDFASWPLAPQVTIPGYSIPGLNIPYTVPEETIRAEDRAERYAVIRAQVMNVHQACLVTSEQVVKRRGALMGFPVTAWQALQGINISSAIHYHDNSENMRHIARGFLNNRDNLRGDRHVSRRIIELDVLEHSMNLLDTILDSNDLVQIQMIESIYLAAFRCYENRLGESITLAWNVCEQLISLMWTNMLDSMQSSNRMTRNRRNQLTNRDYTASVISEILEIGGLIDFELLRLLNRVRKSRNRWSHEMKEPDEREVRDSIKVSQILLERIKGIHLELPASRTGAVPQWNVRYVQNP